MEDKLSLDLISPFLKINDLLTLSLVSKHLTAITSHNKFWKGLLSQKFNVSEKVLNEMIWEKDITIFRRIFINFSKISRCDFFTFIPNGEHIQDIFLLLAISGSLPLLSEYLHGMKNDLQVVDSRGRNALDYAAFSGNVHCFRLLLFKNLPIRNQQNGCNLLHSAAIGGNVDIIKEVIKLKIIPIDTRDSQNRNVIFLAVLSGNIDAVKYLLSIKNIPPNCISFITKMNPLHHAACIGNFPLFKLLIETNQFDCTDVDCFNRNILHFACRGKYKYICEYIHNHIKEDLKEKDRFGFFPEDYLERKTTKNFRESYFWRRIKKKQVDVQAETLTFKIY